MRKEASEHFVDSSYSHFYVADSGLDPEAPEVWTEAHINKRFNALPNIVALCTVSPIRARVLCIEPGSKYSGLKKEDFEVITSITIESGRLGVFSWPREPLQEYAVNPGVLRIRFLGFNMAEAQSGGDFYVVEFEYA